MVIGPAVLGIGLFVVAPTALGRYDEGHRVTVECTVTSATAGSHSSVSRVGAGGGPRAQVELETEECGSFLLRSKITKENVDKAASNFTPGASYWFEVGAGSWAGRDVIAALNKSPFLYAYEPVSL